MSSREFNFKASPIIHINSAYLHTYFSQSEISRGSTYAKTGRVTKMLVAIDGHSANLVIHAKVQGRKRKPYNVSIHFEDNEPEGDCSCPVGCNCKHVVAALVVLQGRQQEKIPASPTIIAQPTTPADTLGHPASHWIDQFGQSLLSKPNHEVIVYLVSLPDVSYRTCDAVKVQTCMARQLQKGGFGKPQPFYPSTEFKKDKITEDDLEIYGLLDMVGESDHPLSGHYRIPLRTKDRLFQRMIATGRCYWESIHHRPPLKKMPQAITATLEWRLGKDGAQQLVCLNAQGQPLPNIIPLIPPWTVDAETSQVSMLDLSLPNAAATTLLTAPRIPPAEARQFVKQVKKMAPANLPIPLPTAFNRIEQRCLKPVPKLQVYQEDVACEEDDGCDDEITKKPCMLANLTFAYGDHEVSSNDTSEPMMTHVEGDALIQVTRNFQAESQHVSRLQEGAITRFDEQHDGRLFIGEQNDIDRALHFGESLVPRLKAAGWDVEFDAQQFYNLLAIDAWYSELDEKSEYDWFTMDMGVLVEGKKVSLLPYLIEAIQHLERPNDAAPYYLKLPQGKVLPIPAERIQRIVGVLTQFIDPNRLNTQEPLRISRYNAALLAEIEKAFHKTQLRWMGGERLRALGKRLSRFSAIKSVKLPKRHFSAELRPYQQQGVNWLQFLREYTLNGILADDMGLGKTLQTLGHIVIEKQKKRLTHPCLIIAPTSVVSNWKSEAERFTPSLRVLVLRGPERKAEFEDIPQHDIVLTTYPLIVRDKDDLLKHSYHMVILDEAQYVKNAQAKMTQIVQQFQAARRLCLTGTPLENHLGELWSLFNFLMPGLLGNPADFKRLYRTPIEKHQNKECLDRLTKIVKPFMLRRTKEEVVKDLPKKTDIVQKATLEPQQRDLYESIRLAMHRKVRDAIDQKGIERCHIIILDALLKLRQVCCDPRLVKLKAAQKVKGSAKLQLLSSMVSEMVEEGRRILLFSQFTSMLGLIEEDLKTQRINYVKLTGSTRNRAKPVQQFQSGEVPVFLISLKAGGTGINLTAADTVIHYDPWWNPAVENQATDRAYRIGQDKPVFVYKLVAENTVEEKILEMQEKKQSLMTALFSGETNKAKLNKKDLEFLLAP
ncbi:SNF2-related protein [Candidiatus Paracoxiella cheracis]|uniref:DEAD/DEAH box helicase n=1 Tax=Candidiatus Paracoxiella cheracis TaxID=3405120 RepID=UPI003BF5DA4E